MDCIVHGVDCATFTFKPFKAAVSEGSSLDREYVCLVAQSCSALSNSINYRASQVDQMVKNLPAVQETWIQSLRLEDPLEKGMATHYSILARRVPWREEPGSYSPWGCKELGTAE